MHCMIMNRVRLHGLPLKGEDEARRLAAVHTNDAHQLLKPVGGDSSFPK